MAKTNEFSVIAIVHFSPFSFPFPVKLNTNLWEIEKVTGDPPPLSLLVSSDEYHNSILYTDLIPILFVISFFRAYMPCTRLVLLRARPCHVRGALRFEVALTFSKVFVSVICLEGSLKKYIDNYIFHTGTISTDTQLNISGTFSLSFHFSVWFFQYPPIIRPSNLPQTMTAGTALPKHLERPKKLFTERKFNINID